MKLPVPIANVPRARTIRRNLTDLRSSLSF
jgi:hypothetical protein